MDIGYPSELLAQCLQRKGFRASRRFADFAHILDVQIDQVLECRGVDLRSLDRRVAEINPPFGRGRPLARIVMAKERLARIRLLAPDLNSPAT